MTPFLVFASGSNHAGEIEGFGRIGQHVGVAAPEVNAAAERALLALPEDVHVFVDSGAFSEVAFGPDGPQVVKPIPDADWARRLALYSRLASLGPRLHVVAPDQVGNQDVTLARMRTYAPEIQALVRRGVDVLVPLQQGARSLLDFERAAADALGLSPGSYTPAIPSKKDATPTSVMLAYAAARRPVRMHLLGLGPNSPRLPEILAGLARVSPNTRLSLDANRITASVGRDKPGGRRLTAATDYVGQRDIAQSYQSEGGYVALIGDPAAWLGPNDLRKVGKAAGLTGAQLRAWVDDPTTRPDDPRLDAALDETLDHAWAAYTQRASTTTRKRDAVTMAFGREHSTPAGIVGALYDYAAREMVKPTNRLYLLVELLDDIEWRRQVERAIARALRKTCAGVARGPT